MKKVAGYFIEVEVEAAAFMVGAVIIAGVDLQDHFIYGIVL